MAETKLGVQGSESSFTGQNPREEKATEGVLEICNLQVESSGEQ